MTNRTRTGIALMVLALGLGGCGRSDSPSTVSAPSPVPQVVPPAPVLPPPSITAVIPNIGSTSWTGDLMIAGTGFQNFAKVTLGGNAVAGYAFTSTQFVASAPVHAAGIVDVVVTNPDGRTFTLPGGYTYVSPESFEVNGTWEGGADSNYMTPFRFTIQNNTLTSVSCDDVTLTLSPPPSVSHGEFSFLGRDGASLSGRIVAPDSALGHIARIGPCSDYPWYATRQ